MSTTSDTSHPSQSLLRTSQNTSFSPTAPHHTPHHRRPHAVVHLTANLSNSLSGSKLAESPASASTSVLKSASPFARAASTRCAAADTTTTTITLLNTEATAASAAAATVGEMDSPIAAHDGHNDSVVREALDAALRASQGPPAPQHPPHTPNEMAVAQLGLSPNATSAQVFPLILSRAVQSASNPESSTTQTAMITPLATTVDAAMVEGGDASAATPHHHVASPTSPPSPPSHNASTDTRVGEFVREAVNEADMPPGLLRFLQGQKQQGLTSPVTTPQPSTQVVPNNTQLSLVNELPPAAWPAVRYTQPSSAMDATTPKKAAIAAVHTLPPLPLFSSKTGPQPLAQQQGQHVLPLSTAPANAFPCRTHDATTPHRGSETRAAGGCADTPTVVAAAMPSRVAGTRELREVDQLPLPPTLEWEGVAAKAGAAYRSSDGSGMQRPPFMSNSEVSTVRTNTSGANERLSLTGRTTAMGAELSLTQVIGSESSSLNDSAPPPPRRFAPSPPLSAAVELSSGGRRRVADVDNGEGSAYLHGLRRCHPEGTTPNGATVTPVLRVDDRRDEPVEERPVTLVKDGDDEDDANHEDDVVSNGSSAGVKSILCSPTRPQERKRRCNSPQRTPNAPPPSLASAAARVQSRLPESQVPASEHSPATASSTLDVSRVSLQPFSPASSVAAQKKRTTLFTAPSLVDAPPFAQQQHRLQQQLQQQQAPTQSSQLAQRRLTTVSLSSTHPGTSLLDDSAAGMNFVEATDATPRSPMGGLEPSLMAGVAWMDSFSPYTSFTSPNLTQTTSATTTTTTNRGSVAFTNSTTQSVGPHHGVPVTLSEQSITRVAPWHGSSSQSLTSRQRRPLTAAVQPTSFTTAPLLNAGLIAQAVPTPLPSSGKYSGRQHKHEHCVYLAPQTALFRSASSGTSMADSSVSSNVPGLLMDRSGIASMSGSAVGQRHRALRLPPALATTMSPLADNTNSCSSSPPPNYSGTTTSVVSFMRSSSGSAC